MPTAKQTSSALSQALRLDSSLREATGYDDVTGIGSATDRFIVEVGKG
jgi:hypothetical protein